MSKMKLTELVYLLRLCWLAYSLYMHGGTKLGIVLGGVIIVIVIVKTPTKMYKQIQGRTDIFMQYK